MYQHNSFYLLLILDSLKVHVPAQQFLPSAIRHMYQHNSFYLLLILDSLKVHVPAQQFLPSDIRHVPAQQFLPSADIRQSQSTCTSTTVSTFC